VFRIPIFEHKDIKINYFKRGKGEILLMIPGFGQAYESWGLQISYFRRKMMVLSLDNRGAGKSSKSDYPYTMDMFTNDIHALLNHLNIETQIHLVGHSMGGMIAQSFVLKYPEIVKTLTILAAPTYIDDSFNQVTEQLEASMQDPDLEARFKKMSELSYSESFIKRITQNKSLYENILHQFIEQNTKFTLKDYINQQAAMSGFDTAPIEHSKILNEKIPNSRLELFEGLGHAFTIEDPLKVNTLIWNFIQQHLELVH
jgi:pimeloyl-ACP methyl ester carboxylesterase